ncbi:MAG: phage virion morphogenesis protein [Candidatus Magnetominusculus sp. LBB02]|nr:phage virion morphogenesis protein [Candidatus Magnetominusculus sp. LBB02]
MSGALIEVTIDDGGVIEALSLIAQRVTNLKPAMQLIGKRVTASVKENFRAGGRPQMWIPSQRAKATGTQTLIDTKNLMNTIHPTAYNDRVEIGTNVKYAAIHQFGGYTGRGHKSYIPPRPFLMVQDGDWAVINETLLDYIARLK